MQQVPAASERLQHRLGVMWRDLLGVDCVAPEDSFFELGGTSLLVDTLLDRRDCLTTSTRKTGCSGGGPPWAWP